MERKNRDFILAPDWLINGSGQELPKGSAVRVKGSFIKAVGPLPSLDPDSADVQFLSGQTLMPGLIDCHGYLSVDPTRPDPMGGMHGLDMVDRAWTTARHLRIDLASGVTTLRVMGEGGGLDYRARQAVTEGQLLGPRLLCSGTPVCPSHSHQAAASGGADGVEGVRAAVRKRIAEGADWLKLVVTGGVNAIGDRATTALYSDGEIAAAIEEAHIVGLPIAVAAHGGPTVAKCAKGVRTIEHCAFFDEATLLACIDHDVALVLTLARFFRPDGIELSGRQVPGVQTRLERARSSLRRLVPNALKRGARIVLGTDNMHGLIAEDAKFFAEFGASNRTALASLTGTAAKVIGVDLECGEIRQDLRADFLVVQGNPLVDVSVLRHPKQVFKLGNRLIGLTP